MEGPERERMVGQGAAASDGATAVPGRIVGAHAPPMRSPVNWALLGLVIEKPSYAYDLAHRFERRYGSVLALSNVGHVYTAISALAARRLIREIEGSRQGRQPKPRYEATKEGIEQYGAWLVSQAEEDRRQREFFVLALRALAPEPEALLDVFDRCEQAWLAQGTKTRIGARAKPSLAGCAPSGPAPAGPAPANPSPSSPSPIGQSQPGLVAALLDRLIAEDTRLAVGAKLQWARYAREQLAHVMKSQTSPSR